MRVCAGLAALMGDQFRRWQPITPGDALTRWAMTAPTETHYPGTARPMPDMVDYRFINGRVNHGDMPCREALWAELPSRGIARPEGPFDQLHLGFDGPNVDFSRFCHRPTLVRRGFRCLLRSDGGGLARVRLTTCGGVRIWADDVQVVRFEPFRRNRPQTAEFDIALAGGETRVTLQLEDLHERDTSCFFSLVLLEGPAISVSPGLDCDPAQLGQVAALLAGLRTDRVFGEQGTVRLIADDPPEIPVTLRIEGLVPFDRGGLSRDPEVHYAFDAVMTASAAGAPLFEPASTAPGCLSFEVSAMVGPARLTRSLGVSNLPPAHSLTGDLVNRKTVAARMIAGAGGFDPAAAALMAIARIHPRQVGRIVAAALTSIEERHDCSDFSVLPLLRLWRDGRDSLDPALRARLRDAILGYRYWLDQPGDDVMWFWSENHVLCFHTAQMIAGGLFPDEVFVNSGQTGSALRADATGRLHRWFDSIARHGLCEWNSAAYYPIDLLALFTLHDMEPEMLDRCRALMDRIFAMTALHTSGGVPAGSQGRCYEKELLAGPVTELGSVAAIAFGGAFRPGFDRAAALFCLSGYQPPEPLTALALPKEGDWLAARYTQGLGHAGKLTLWKSAQGQLSSVTEIDTGAEGHQVQVLDVQLSAHPMARLWINHPGDLKPWGDRRPSLLAGNHVMPRVAQYGPTGMLIYDLDQPWTDIGFTQLFAAPDAFDGQRRIGDWLVFSAGESQAAVWCSRELEGVEGLYKGALLRAHGQRTAWVVALPMPAETRGDFADRLIAAAPVFDVPGLRLCATGYDGAALVLDHRDGWMRDGVPQPFDILSPIPHVGWNGAPLLPVPGLEVV